MEGLPKTYIYLGLLTTLMFIVTAFIQQRSIFAIYALISLIFTLGVVAINFIKNKDKKSGD